MDKAEGRSPTVVHTGAQRRKFFSVKPKPTPGEAKKWPQSKKPFVIPGLTRNPVRQSNLAALRAGENDSGFRVKPGMTKCWRYRRALALASSGGIRENSECGALRRRKRFWIPDQVRNDEVLGCSPGVGFGNARWNPFRCFAALRAGEMNRRTIVRSAKTSRRRPNPV
ncbi:MAG: hypothetical protein LBS70_00235, partial [Candidatus Accumulibacter sp.]|nr:hypothetical protein [Accumulibacter sp.]